MIFTGFNHCPSYCCWVGFSSVTKADGALRRLRRAARAVQRAGRRQLRDNPVLVCTEDHASHSHLLQRGQRQPPIPAPCPSERIAAPSRTAAVQRKLAAALSTPRLNSPKPFAEDPATLRGCCAKPQELRPECLPRGPLRSQGAPCHYQTKCCHAQCSPERNHWLG